MTAASHVLKDVVSRVEKDIREGKTMRRRKEHGPLYEEAKSRLIEARIVGFHAEGGQPGRAEAISWILLCSQEEAVRETKWKMIMLEDKLK